MHNRPTSMRHSLAWAVLTLAAVYGGFAAYVLTSSKSLPPRVATHFNAAGRPDGWMSRSQHVTWALAGGAVVPLIVVATMFAARFASDDAWNLPRKAYWLAADRRGETMDYLLRHAVWLGCWLVLFFAGLQYLLVEANARRPAAMGERVWWLVGVFVAGVAAWIIVLARHFARAGAGDETQG